MELAVPGFWATRLAAVAGTAAGWMVIGRRVLAALGAAGVGAAATLLCREQDGRDHGRLRVDRLDRAVAAARSGRGLGRRAILLAGTAASLLLLVADRLGGPAASEGRRLSRDDHGRRVFRGERKLAWSAGQRMANGFSLDRKRLRRAGRGSDRLPTARRARLIWPSCTTTISRCTRLVASSPPLFWSGSRRRSPGASVAASLGSGPRPVAFELWARARTPRVAVHEIVDFNLQIPANARSCSSSSLPWASRRSSNQATRREGAAHIVHVVGARPNFTKIAPILAACASRAGSPRDRLVHTGQHLRRIDVAPVSSSSLRSSPRCAPRRGERIPRPTDGGRHAALRAGPSGAPAGPACSSSAT